MQRITGIPENDLQLVLDDLEAEGASLIAKFRSPAGSWTVEFMGPAAETRNAAEGEQDPADAAEARIELAKSAASARVLEPRKILYIDSSGRAFVRMGGSRAWRNFNPGNIRKGSFADAHGAVGDDGAFAIFPDEQTGFAALTALLATATYSALNLRQAIHRYAPPSENDSDSYVDFVVAKTGLSPQALLSATSDEERRAIAGAIKTIEGWQEGEEFPITPVS